MIRLFALTLTTVALTGCGESAASYCHGIYDDGGSTPPWAEKDDLFSDYASCVEWYDFEAEEVHDQGG